MPGLPTHVLLDGDTLPAAMLGTVFAETFADPDGVVGDRYPAGCLVALPADWYTRPMRWTGTAFADDVDGERGRLIAAAAAARRVAQDGGCPTPLGRVQTDPASRTAIQAGVSGAIVAKVSGASFSIVWTMEDNSQVAHSADAMIAMGTAVLLAADAAQAKFVAARAALDAATTLHALWAIVPRSAA